MMSKGLRISDEKNEIISFKLPDILKEIKNGNDFHWAILDFDGSGALGEDKPIPGFKRQILDSENGYFISWDELFSLSFKFWEIVDITLIGCKNQKLLKFYEDEIEMYETCDIVIEMIDSSFWQVFSKDEELINRLAKKFKEVEFLEPDFER